MSKISHGILTYLSLLIICLNSNSPTYFVVSYGRIEYSQSIQQMFIAISLQNPILQMRKLYKGIKLFVGLAKVTDRVRIQILVA